MEEAPPLSGWVKANFGIGQIAEGIKGCAFGTFLLFYYNNVLGLNADLAGLAIAVALVFDAVTDPVAGSVSDRWHGPRGRRHPFMYASAVPLGVAFVLLFDPWVSLDSVGQYGLFAWMLVATVLTRASMTLYHVPHLALGAELSEDYDERTQLVAIRNFLGSIGYILVYALGFGYFFAPSDAFPNGQENAAAYPGFAISLGVIMAVTILLSAFGTRSRIPYLPKPKVVEARVRVVDVILETFEAMKNPSFRWLMFGFILFIVAVGIAGSIGLYMYTYFWRLNPYQIMSVLLLLPFGAMLGYVIAGRLFAWLDKRDAMIVGGVFWMIFHALPVLLYLAGWAPPPGSWGMVVFLALLILAGGACVAQVLVGLGTGMADIADENELDTGRRQEGVFFGASSFANKCSGALGTLLAGLLLEAIGWPAGAATAEIPQETLLQLALWAGPFTSLVALPGVLCLRGYRLNRERLRDIQAELRRSATA